MEDTAARRLHVRTSMGQPLVLPLRGYIRRDSKRWQRNVQENLLGYDLLANTVL